MLRSAVYRLLVILHLLGATVWVGGHLVLSLVVLPRALRTRDASVVAEFESGYERIGLPALLLQVITGVWLALHWVPDIRTWLAPASLHGWLVLVKLGLLAATLALAAHARFRLVPTLDAGALSTLAFHIVGVTLLGVAMLITGVAIRTGGVW
jgi:putative copper export protein